MGNEENNIYRVSEIYRTIQGEGFNAGQTCIIIRFQGCNINCPWCDTPESIPLWTKKAAGYETLSLAQIIGIIHDIESHNRVPLLILTGGEPAIQANVGFVEALQKEGYRVAIESNGTIPISDRGLDWITISPKPHSVVKQIEGDELKLVFPDNENKPPEYWLANTLFSHYYISPMWASEPDILRQNINEAIEYCAAHPTWKISLQIHKLIGVR